MPNLSNRGSSMPASPIRKLVPYAEAAEKAGKKVYYLNIGQPDIETPPEFIEAIRAFEPKVLAYSHSAGNESYRRKLAGYYQSHDIDITFENLLVTTGGSEALLFGFLTCLNPDDEIIIPEPFYANYNGFSVSSHVKVRPITAKIENGFALPPIENFEKLINERTKAIMICNPNNPTGYLYSREELEALKELVLKHDLFLFADEVYREFVYDPNQKHHSVLNLEGLDQHAVVFDSVSKRYSACGARIGALVTRNRDIINNALKFAQARLSPPTLEQVGAEAAVDVDQSYFTKTIAEYKNRRDTVVSRLNAMEGVFCPEPGGAFYCTVRLPIDDCDEFAQWMLEDYSLEGQTLMVAPASGFYSDSSLGKDEIRVAYVLNETELNKAMDVLETALVEYKKVKASLVVSAE